MQVNLDAVVLEFILRSGVPLEATLVNNYGPERGYPGVFGLSVLHHVGYSVDQLAQAGHFPHGRISYAVVQQLRDALTHAGYEMLLTHTPTAVLPDHHTLGVARGGTALQNLPSDAAQALGAALTTITNAYRQRQP